MKAMERIAVTLTDTVVHEVINVKRFPIILALLCLVLLVGAAGDEITLDSISELRAWLYETQYCTENVETA